MKYIKHFENNTDLIRFGEFHHGWHAKLNKIKNSLEMTSSFEILDMCAVEQQDSESIPLFDKNFCEKLEKYLLETKKDYDNILHLVKLMEQEYDYESMIFTIKPYGVWNNDYKVTNTSRNLNIEDAVFELYIGFGNKKDKAYNSLQKVNTNLMIGVSEIIKTLESKGSNVEVNLLDDIMPIHKFRWGKFQVKSDSSLVIVFNLPY